MAEIQNGFQRRRASPKVDTSSEIQIIRSELPASNAKTKGGDWDTDRLLVNSESQSMLIALIRRSRMHAMVQCLL